MSTCQRVESFPREHIQKWDFWIRNTDAVHPLDITKLLYKVNLLSFPKCIRIFFCMLSIPFSFTRLNVFFFTNLLVMNWCVLICIFLVATNEVEHHFKVFGPCIFTSVYCYVLVPCFYWSLSLPSSHIRHFFSPRF